MLTYTRDKGEKQTIWGAMDIPQRGRQLQEAIARGLPYPTFLRIARYAEMTNAELVGLLGISVSTLRRRANAGKLNVDESEKIIRLIQMMNAELTLFDGNKEKALSWLKSPSRGLNDIQPIKMISTYMGTNEVLALIGRLEHGVYC
jgi:putative toxin-antitoxin system antitoxin component (TIGR02293 family)